MNHIVCIYKTKYKKKKIWLRIIRVYSIPHHHRIDNNILYLFCCSVFSRRLRILFFCSSCSRENRVPTIRTSLLILFPAIVSDQEYFIFYTRQLVVGTTIPVCRCPRCARRLYFLCNIMLIRFAHSYGVCRLIIVYYYMHVE